MLMGVNGMNNGVNYDPMNPMGTHSWRKDAKAANRIAGLVTKYAPAPPPPCAYAHPAATGCLLLWACLPSGPHVGEASACLS
jgi:hypothetical protein